MSRRHENAVPPLRGTLVVLTCALAGGACDIPTELPDFDTVWEGVLLRDTVATVDLLPPEMRIDDAGFVLDSFTTTNQVRLEDVCELCTCFEGPIPPLTIAPQDFRVRLPSRLLEARLDRGGARLVVHNEAGFDVLEDEHGNQGHLLVKLLNSVTGEVLDSLRIQEPFPPGDSLTVDFDLAGLELSNRLVARVSGETPGSGCDDVDLTPESGFRAEVELMDVLAPDVKVIISDASLAIPDRDYDLPDFVAERLRPGDARVSLAVEIDALLPTETEFLISAAATPQELFGETSALFTPLVVPEATGSEPVKIRKTFLADLQHLEGADHLHLATRNQVLGSRIVDLVGGESVAYTVRLHAEIPSR